MSDTNKRRGERPSVTLPEQLCDILRSEIGSIYAVGDKLPTMRELRDQFGVSINTVSAAIERLAEDGLVSRRPGSGIFVIERRKRVGILSEMDLLDTRISPHFRRLANAMREQLLANNMEPRLYMGHSAPEHVQDEITCPDFWADYASGSLDAAIIHNAPSSQEWLQRIHKLAIPSVGFHTGYTVEVDHEAVLRAAVARLAKQGCTRLGLLTWSSPAAFLTALRKHGISTRDAWVRNDLPPAARGAGWEAFRELWLSSDEKPDGLVVTDDMLFADAQIAIMELGIEVPERLKLAVQVNRGCTPLVRLPATLLEVSPDAMAAAMTDLLLQRLDERDMPPQNRRISHSTISASNVTTRGATS